MTTAQGALLLHLARASIYEALGGPGFAMPAEPWLREPGASFVTLMQAGELRGCIGTLEAWRALGDDVVHNARAAALQDMRFDPLTPAELGAVDIEVSVLSAPETIAFASDEALYESLRPGIDGVVLRAGARTATFLPQVWAQLADPREFIAQLQRKAGVHGLPLSQCVVQRYTVDKWREVELGTKA